MWLKRHWPLFGATLLWAEPVGRVLKWAIGRGGDVDFLVSRARDPDWVGDMLTLLTHPLATVALIATGFALIYWDMKRSRVRAQGVSHNMVWPLVLMALGAGAFFGGAIWLYAVTQGIPTPTTRTYAEADRIEAGQAVRYLIDDSRWGRDRGDELAMLALEDAARRGSIKAWGQACLNYSLIAENSDLYGPDGYEFTGNTIEIPQEDWERMSFVFRSLKKPRADWIIRHMTAPHDGDQPCYGYIQLDAVTLKEIWPPLD